MGEVLVMGDGFSYRYDYWPYAREIAIYKCVPGPFGQFGTGPQIACVRLLKGESEQEALARYQVDAGLSEVSA